MVQPVREIALDALTSGAKNFDIIVVGGGITGAGIAREAACSGLSTLLVEQRDFAWGTSSRSSKMVHGGLRYLGSGQFGLTRDAVRERQRLLREVPGLVNPLQFVMPHYRRQFPGPRLFGLLLTVYDWIAGRRSRQRFTPAETLNWVPGLHQQGLVAASGFTDAVTDDARLVQRIIEEARNAGAWCLNYLAVKHVEPASGGKRSITIQDTATPSGASFTVSAPVIVNATGAWASNLTSANPAGKQRFIRPLRGSHLVLPYDALPVSCSVSLLHPEDRRPVFAFPWHGMTILGTTDLDHQQSLDLEPGITQAEVDYLLKIASTLFPGHKVTEADVVSSWAGVRPVVSEGTANAPSRESREHDIWDDHGLISVAGGKLTTYRLIARELLDKSRAYLPRLTLCEDSAADFTPAPDANRPDSLRHNDWVRLKGWYGPVLPQLLKSGPLSLIPGSDTYWCELVWAAQHADVVHLDDLMLRRTRLGLVLPNGGEGLLDEVQELCSEALPWDEQQWLEERKRYLNIWRQHYSLPASAETHHDAE